MRLKNNRIKELFFFTLMLTVSLVLNGCSESEEEDGKEFENKVLQLEEIRNSEVVESYFNDKNVKLSEIELEKRQTNGDDKEDIAYVNVIAENDEVKLYGSYAIKSEFYDVGGWQVEEIYSDGDIIYEPKGEPQFNIEINNCEINIVQTIEQDDNKYLVEYERIYGGKIAEIKESWMRTYQFDIKEGVWKVELDEQNGYEIEVYIDERLYEYENKVTTYSDDKYLIKFHEGRASMVLYEKTSGSNNYNTYDLGESELKWDDSSNVYYYEFEARYGNVISIVITTNELYADVSSGTNNGWYTHILKAEGNYTIVPSCIGKNREEVLEILENQCYLNVIIKFVESEEEEETVISMSVKEGTEIERGAYITIFVSGGNYSDTVEIPQVEGKAYDKAKKELESLGLVVEKQEIYHDTVQTGNVITTDLKAGMTVPRGTVITLVISLGEE